MQAQWTVLSFETGQNYATKTEALQVAGGVVLKTSELHFDKNHANPSVSTAVAFVPGATLSDFVVSQDEIKPSGTEGR